MTFVNSKGMLRKQLLWVAIIGGVILAIELINMFSARALVEYGIVPRTLNTLPHVLTSAFIHGSFHHFSSNIITLCAFSFLLLQYGTKRFVIVSLVLVVLGGLLVWLLARPAIHIGASGLVYGYFGYLLLAGFLGRSFRLFAISVIIGLFYGSMVFGVFPSQGFVSWESHLFGFLTGLLLAYLFRNKSDLRKAIG